MTATYNLILRRNNRIVIERTEAESKEEATTYASDHFSSDILLDVIEITG